MDRARHPGQHASGLDKIPIGELDHLAFPTLKLHCLFACSHHSRRLRLSTITTRISLCVLLHPRSSVFPSTLVFGFTPSSRHFPFRWFHPGRSTQIAYHMGWVGSWVDFDDVGYDYTPPNCHGSAVSFLLALPSSAFILGNPRPKREGMRMSMCRLARGVLGLDRVGVGFSR